MSRPKDDGRRGYIEAWNLGTNKKLWELTIFPNGIDPSLEEDAQWVFIRELNIQDGRLGYIRKWKDLSARYKHESDRAT